MADLATIPGFYGRQQELEHLTATWEQVAGGGGPRMAIILGESGVGKSRLVQAFYQWLASHERWDPPEWNYWPDDFGNLAGQLRVNPHLEGHEPQGPPKFFWLGVRWQDPGERNVEERICPLPEAARILETHVEVARRFSDDWAQLLLRKLQDEVTAKGLWKPFAEEALGKLVPFAGLFLKVGEHAWQALREQRDPTSAGELGREKLEDAGDHLLSLFEGVFGGLGKQGVALPTVFWLDDAHFMDPLTASFLGRLWQAAEAQRWPLFLVVTHWLREWRELRRLAPEQRERSLARFEGRERVEIFELGNAGNAELAAYLASQLPGLTREQEQLLLAKAGGNFLTMVENVGLLKRQPRYFQDRDLAKPLTDQGVQAVKDWEPERSRRIKQRFDELDEKIQDLLAWSSRLGSRFFEEVLVTFARDQGREEGEVRELLGMCEDPLVILGRPAPVLWEFRDRAWFEVARSYFAKFHEATVAAALDEALRSVLVAWVDRAFDEKAEPLLPGGLPQPPSDAVTALPAAARLELLDLASRVLPRDVSAPHGQAGVRARALYLWELSESRLWEKVLEVARFAEALDWAGIPEEVLGLQFRGQLASICETAGALAAASGILQDLAARLRRALSSQPNPATLRWLSGVLGELGDVGAAQGDWGKARGFYEESLGMRRDLAQRLGTPESLRDVSVSLERLGDVARAQGDLPKARSIYEESLWMRRDLAQRLGTPERLRDLAVSLYKLGVTAKMQGNLEEAARWYREALDILRSLAARLGTPQALEEARELEEELEGVLAMLGEKR